MKTSDSGIEAIKEHEALRVQAYKDDGGVWTIGYGHTGAAAKPGAQIDELTAKRLLRDDLQVAEHAVNSQVKVDLSQSEFDAMVSFVFNVGAAAFKTSTLLAKLNVGKYDEVDEQLMRWVYIDGKRSRGLANRRAKEAALWNKGHSLASARPSKEKTFVKSNTLKGTLAASAGLIGGVKETAGEVGGIAEVLLPNTTTGMIFTGLLIAGLVFVAVETARRYGVIDRIRATWA